MKERDIKRDLTHINLMITNFENIEKDIAWFSKLGANIYDERVLRLLAFNLAQAGEQVGLGKISEELKEEFPDVDWARMKKTRNFISHSYQEMDVALLIKIIKSNVPKYIEQLYEVRKYLKSKLED